LFTRDNNLLNNIKLYLDKRWKTKFLGEAVMFIGIKITKHSDGSYSLNQQHYIDKILANHKMMNCNHVPTPMVKDYLNREAGKEIDSKEYKVRNSIGSFMWLSATRPDIVLAVNILSRELEKPTDRTLQGIKRLCRYLKATRNYGIYYKAQSHSYNTKISEFTIYSDADHAGDKSSRKSTGGYFMKIGTGAVSYQSKKQNAVAQSSCESETISLVETSKEAMWVRKLLCDIQNLKNFKIDILCDNTAAINMAHHPTSHNRTKHFDYKVKYLRDQIQKGTFKLTYVSTEENIADILTKPLSDHKFRYFREKLCIIQL